LKGDPQIMDNTTLASRLQYTIVNPAATKEMVIRHVEACVRYGFHAAMIPMYWAPLARAILHGTSVRVATFICIGMGHESVASKCMLLRECWASGADEVDYQPNMSLFLSGMEREFAAEAETLVRMTDGRPLKAMLELGYLREEADKIRAARLLAEAGVPWIKNSSGVGDLSEPATEGNIALLRRAVGDIAHVKASGKIRERIQAEALIAAGAELLGTSAAPAIIDARSSSGGGY
jgi:deoxyribose-phosphate aldolase